MLLVGGVKGGRCRVLILSLGPTVEGGESDSNLAYSVTFVPSLFKTADKLKRIPKL